MGQSGMRLRQDHQRTRRAALALGCALALFALLGTSAPPVAADSAPAAPGNPGAGLPVRLKIPVIGVDAPVEYVGLTPDGLMDVPKKWEDTAWYQLGPRPGNPGNAVIAGHVDSTNGTAVFWKLRRLKPGDQLSVVGDDGIERRFVVTAMERYDRTNAPLYRIFGPADGTHLNLITCDVTSNYDPTQQEYASSLVVYTDAVP